MSGVLADAAVVVSRSTELSLVVKATVILVGTLASLRLMRAARASARHLVVAASFGALLALPIMVLTLPAVGIEVPASTTTAALLPPPAPDA